MEHPGAGCEGRLAGRDRGAVCRERARQALGQGRLAESLAWFKKARRAPLTDEPAQVALEESEALLGLARYGDAVRVATRALGRRPKDADRKARLRVVRALALWELGRVALARNELRKAGPEAVEPLSRGRVEEAWARLAWKAHRIEEARASLAGARVLYERAAYSEGVVRTLEAEAALLRDVGRIDEALETQTRRLAIAAAAPRQDSLARARSDRGALLIVMGRWSEAREDLDRAAELFRQLGDPREITLAGVTRAVADLAMGDLVQARRGVERACEFSDREGGSPRELAEALLLLADVHQAAGQPEAADEACVRAQRLFVLLKDRGGACWACIRRSQALLEQGRTAEALREARRAQAKVPPEKVHVRAWAHLALGRILLRSAPAEAAAAFSTVQSLSEGRPGLTDMAAVGVALARHAHPEDPALREAVGRLEAWGDRQMLSLCLGDIREMVGIVPAVERLDVRGVEPSTAVADSGPALVEAALTLAGGGGWVSAAQGLRQWLPWCRVAWLADASWELRCGEDAPRPLGARDLAFELKSRLEGPCVVRLTRDGPYRRHPVRVLHDLGMAALVPLESGGALYMDFRSEADLSEGRVLETLLLFARLVEAHEPPPRSTASESSLPGVIGESPAMREVYRCVRRVAEWPVPVHIYGETGTGKELVARALHAHSLRARGPFVPVNASSLSEELFESQMFGHVRGSFTSAVATSQGFVAMADKGTLFLDEVADLPRLVQAKLLRFVQEGEYGRLGEPTLRKADIRLVTATNVDLRSRVASGLFRADLMYRLLDWTISLPPLRDRGDDVLRLAQHFIRDTAEGLGRPVPALGSAAARLIRQHAWPGNVRELQIEMRGVVVRAEGRSVRPEHLSDVFRAAGGGGQSSLREARLGCEREHIASVLQRCGGNRTRAAAALGISRQWLQGKLREAGLE